MKEKQKKKTREKKIVLFLARPSGPTGVDDGLFDRRFIQAGPCPVFYICFIHLLYLLIW